MKHLTTIFVKSKQALHVFLTGLFLLIISHTYSQNVFQKTYGGTNLDYGDHIKYTTDGGFVVTGTTTSFGTGASGIGTNNPRDLYISKANILGVTTWTKELGSANTRQEGKILTIAADGGYLVGGRTFESTSDANDSWLIGKYNTTGTLLNQYVLGKNSVTSPTSVSWDDEVFAIQETPIPNLVAMFGLTMNYREPNNKENTFVIYNVATGATSTTRHIGDTIAVSVDDAGKDFCTDAFPYSYTLLAETGVGPSGTMDFAAIHLDVSYNLVNYRTFGGTGTDVATSINKTSDGGYLLAGWSNSPGSAGGNDFLVIKTDINFNITWSRMIGGTGDELLFQTEQTSDGGYILIGQTNSFGFGSNDMFVVKLNSAGNLSWAKCYGGSGADDGKSVSLRPDGGFYFTGSCNEPISPAGQNQDIYVVAANSNGYSGGCHETNVTPTVTNSPSLASTTVGLSQITTALQTITQPQTETTVAANITCKCENIAPNKEIIGDIEVCRNSSSQYYINRIPGYTNYSWSISGATFSPAPAATDTMVNVNFTNTNATIIVSTAGTGCSDFIIDTITITVDNISTAITTPDSMLCIGDNTTLTSNTSNAQGGITGWVWNPSGPNNPVNPLTTPPVGSNNYTVTVTDGWGCTATDNITIQVFNYPVVNIGPNDTVCNGGPVPLNATTAGGSYVWSTTATTPTINAPTSGIYWVDVTTNGCTTRDSIILGISTNPTVTITGDDSLCIGQSTILTANPAGGSGTYNFVWAPGGGTSASINPSPTINTIYTVTVTTNFGCTTTGTRLVNVFNYPVVNLGPDSNVCNGVVPFITLDAQNAGSMFNWSTTANTQTVNASTSGIYWVDVTTNGCLTRDSVNINFGSTPTSNYTGNTTICIGTPTTMYGNGSGGTAPLTYTWSQGPTTADSIVLNPTTTTPYSVITSDVAGCSDTAFFTITVNLYPIVNLGDDTTGCNNDPITLIAPATSGTTLWSTGANTNSISFPTAGTAWVDITENGCTTRDSIIVSYYPLPSVNLGSDAVICAIQNQTLDATNIFSSYLWSTGATTPTLDISQTGLYSVSVTSCGITVTDSIMVYMDTFSVLVVSLVPNDCGSSNGSLVVGSTSAYPTTYVWSGAGSGTNPSLTNINDGVYIVSATDSVGCIQNDTIDVVCSIPAIIITQLVTPNGDGKNDTWIIQGINNFTNAVVTVYNKWGNEVYKSVPYNNDWDGKSNSTISLGNDYLPAGTYYYVVDVYGDGSEIKSGYLEFQP